MLNAGAHIAQESPHHAPRDLQQVHFGCPWPLRVSPFLPQARAHALNWMRDFGLAPDRQANVKRFDDWKLAEAAASYPEATPGGLDLAADLMGWYFAPFDDHFDGELGRDPRRAAQLIGDLIAIVDLPEDAPARASYPVAAAFADLWRRSRRTMSPTWRRRAAHHWKKYLIGQLAEAVDRRHARSHDAISCMHQRIATTSADVLIDLIEAVTGFEVPDPSWHTPLLSELRRLSADIIAITNDLVSADKEAAGGENGNNLLLILRNQQGLTRREAIERMRQMVHERFTRFLCLETRVADLDDIVTVRGAVAVRRHVGGLHDVPAGDNEWEHTSGRYRTAATVQACR